MKKIALCAALVLLTVTAAFALPPLRLSAGAGALFASDFGGGIKADYAGLLSFEMKNPWYGGGGFGFFDATYAEASVSFIYGRGNMDAAVSGSFPGLPSGLTGSADYSIMNLGFSLLGKYPFSFGKFTVFPLLGIEYRLALSVKDEDGNDIKDSGLAEAKDFSALWFQFGGGADYALTEKLFLRGSILYGLRFKNKFEKNLVDDFNSSGLNIAEPRLGHGLTVKIAIGYKF